MNILAVLRFPFLAAILVAVARQASAKLPAKLHVVSEVVFRNKGELDYVLVDEYVDRPNNRSSTRVEGSQDGNFIYFNQLWPTNLGDARRDMMRYQATDKTCEQVQINEGTLISELRYASMAILPMELLTNDLMDVALGPSLLLIVLEELLDEFKFAESKFDEKYIARVLIYEHEIEQYDPAAADFEVTRISVSIPFDSAKSYRNQTLRQVVDETGKLEVVWIVVCKQFKMKMRSRNLKEEVCPESSLQSSIYIHSIEKYVSTSLIGSSIDEQEEYNFDEAPFCRPVGIGCFVKDAPKASQLVAPSTQFSAEYITKRGALDLRYVAYDGLQNVLRLDRFGRKNVYDLKSRSSFHIDEFRSVVQSNDKTYLRNGGNARSRNCINIRKAEPKYSANSEYLSSRDTDALVLGIDSEGLYPALLLGTKMVDHIIYQVYEREILFDDFGTGGYRMPILLEPLGYTMPTELDSSRRYFLVYYVLAQPKPFDFIHLAEPSIRNPRYVELWELHLGSKSRSLVNRLEFTDFSWSLDVEPSDGSNSESTEDLFQIPACAEDRSHQASIKFRIVQDVQTMFSSKPKVDGLALSQHILKMNIREILTRRLEISPLNIAMLDVSVVRHPPDIIVDTQLTELYSGSDSTKTLGWVSLDDAMRWFKSSVLKVSDDRHSIEDCQIDSADIPTDNHMIYCPKVAKCILVWGNEVEQRSFDKRLPEEQKGLDQKIWCGVYKYKYWFDRLDDTRSKFVDRIKFTGLRLKGAKFDLDFVYKDPLTKKSELASFIGSSSSVDVSQVDSIRLSSANPPLSGIRYSTSLEETQIGSLNKEYQLDGEHSPLLECHSACILEDFCESFSVCDRSKPVAGGHNCILSPLRLSNARIHDIGYASQKVQDSGDSFDVTFKLDLFSTDEASETYRFKRDSDCSLHIKDSISTYKWVRYFRVSGVDNNYSSDKETGLKTSLEDCASISDSYALGTGSMDARFIYCPMDSVCLLATGLENELEPDQMCYVYEKTHLNLYDKRLNQRLSIKDSKSKKEVTANQLEELKLGRFVEGLNSEQCARDCTLNQAKCLAFDVCTLNVDDPSLCIMYHFRSPISQPSKAATTANLYLPIESDIFGIKAESSASAKVSRLLIADMKCNHHSMKSPYFTIRLREMIAPSSEQLDSIERREKAQLDEDKRQGDEILHEMIEKERQIQKNVAEMTRGGEMHGFQLLFGLILGFVCVLYSGKAVVFVWQWIQQRMAKRNDQLIAHLDLAADITKSDEL